MPEAHLNFLTTALENNNTLLLEKFLSSYFPKDIEDQKKVIDLFSGYLSNPIWGLQVLVGLLINNSALYEYTEKKIAEKILQNDDVPFWVLSCFHDSSTVLNALLSTEKYNQNLNRFSEEAFKNVDINSIANLICSGKLEFIPSGLQTNAELLNALLARGNYSYIESFKREWSFDGSDDVNPFTGDNVTLIIGGYKAGKIDSFPTGMGDNSEALKMVLDSGQYDNDALLWFTEDAFTESTLALFYEKLKEGKIDVIPRFLIREPKVLECIIDSSKNSLLDQMMLSAFTVENVKSFIQKADKVEDFTYLRIANAEEALQDDEILDLLSKKFDDPGLKDKINSLFSKNNQIFESLNLGLLSKPFSSLDLRFIERISGSEWIQKLLLRLNKTNLICIQLFARIVDSLSNSTLDITRLIEKICENGLESKAYEKLLSDIKDIGALSEEEITKLAYTLSKENNPFNINSLSDLSNLKAKRLDAFEQAKNSNQEEQLFALKSSILEKRYGLNIHESYFILSRYLHAPITLKDLEKNGVDTNVIDALSLIKKVDECNDIGELKNMLDKVPDALDIDVHCLLLAEERIRASYAKMYNETLYKPSEKNISKNPKLTDVEYNGQGLTVYELTEDFAMQVHALGAYSDYEVPANFKEAWNIPKIAVHSLCTSYIRSDEIAVARSPHPILGFASFESASFLLQGNHDLISSSYNMVYNISSAITGTLLPPNMCINKTRHNHNETVLERRLLMGEGQFKRQPDYIVYITDSLANDDMSSKLWEETKQASHDFGVPIVVIDRERYLQREKVKMSNLFDQFDKTKDPSIFSELFIKYMNNVVGNRFSSFESKINVTNADKLFDYGIYLAVKMMDDSLFDQADLLLNELSNLLEKETADFAVAILASNRDKPAYLDKKDIVIRLLSCAKEHRNYRNDDEIQERINRLQGIRDNLIQIMSQEELSGSFSL